MKNKIQKLYKNWAFHNIVSHSLSQIVWIATKNKEWTKFLHDFSIPDE
jgi:hypothetical protein